MIIENQGVYYGYKKSKDQQKTEQRFLEMYYPSDPAWRIQIIEQSNEVFEKLFTQ